MLHRILRSASFALALAAPFWAGPAAAGGHGWGHQHGHHDRHHQDHGCGRGDYYAPRYVVHHYHEYHEYPVYYYDPRPEVYHPIVVFGLPSVVFRGSIGGGVGWDVDD